MDAALRFEGKGFFAEIMQKLTSSSEAENGMRALTSYNGNKNSKEVAHERNGKSCGHHARIAQCQAATSNFSFRVQQIPGRPSRYAVEQDGSTRPVIQAA